mgnify:CR=1 FL=1
MIPINVNKIPKYFLTEIFSFNISLEKRTVNAPLLPVIGEAIEAGAKEKLNHKNPVPMMLNRPPKSAYL